MRRFRLPLSILAGLLAVAAAILGSQGQAIAAFLTAISAGWLACAAVASFDLLAGLGVTALAGGGVSIYLAWSHLTALAGGDSICSIDSTFDCDAVNTSKYSELFGVPLPLYGLGFYLALAALTFSRRMARPGHAGALHLVRLGSFFSIGYSVFLFWVSHSMGKWCMFCISLYGINFLLLGLSWAAIARRDSLPQAATQTWPTLGKVLSLSGERSLATALGVGIATFAVGILVYKGAENDVSKGSSSGTDISKLADKYSETASKVELDGSEPVFGDPNAPILVVEYADFACPYCAKAGAFMKDLIRRNPKVQLRFKNYPISGNCNRYVDGERHATACPAATAAECAKEQGKYWELSELLFKNQQYQSDTDIEFMARQIGLDMDAFKICQANPGILQGIRNDVEAANKLDVNGTPAFFIRGIVGDDFVEVHARMETVEELINAALTGVPLPPPGPHKSEE